MRISQAAPLPPLNIFGSGGLSKERRHRASTFGVRKARRKAPPTPAAPWVAGWWLLPSTVSYVDSHRLFVIVLFSYGLQPKFLSISCQRYVYSDIPRHALSDLFEERDRKLPTSGWYRMNMFALIQ